MTDQSRFPIEEKIKSAAKTIEPKEEFSSALWQQLSQKGAKKRTSPSRAGFFRPLRVAALAVAMIAVVIFAVGPQNIVTAFNYLLGYLPGSGFVQNDDSTLYLAKPVVVNQGEYTLTVKQMVADQENAVLTYELSGPAHGLDYCSYDENVLQFPDGKMGLPIGGGLTGGDSTQAHIYYQPLPAGVKTLTLAVSETSQDANCKAPKVWSIDLTLGSLPAGVTLASVAQGQDLQVSEQISVPSAAADAVDVNNVHFSIDSVAVTADNYVVAGHVSGSNPAWSDEFLGSDPDAIQVSDASGKIIPIERDDDEENVQGGFGFKFAKGDYAAPLTIKFQSVDISAALDDSNSFSFEAGTQPQVGQTWTVDQPMNLLGHTITVESVSTIHNDAVSTDQKAVTGYSILTKIDSSLLDVDFRGSGSMAAGDGNFNVSGYPVVNGKQRMEFNYPNGLPTGTVTYRAVNMRFVLNGTWTLQLQLPAAVQ
jgi:hypothetical protein